MTTKPAAATVSANNPCPFLRALVASGALPDDVAPLGRVSQAIKEAAARGDGHPALPDAPIRAVALVANGLGPLQLALNALGGLRLNALRGGPLDKKGVGSGILDRHGQVDAAQLARLAEFASPKADAKGRSDPGLDLDELRAMMDANFDRAAGRRRVVDRKMMDFEWPVLLQVMGKQGRDGRYLSLKEVRDLFVKRQLPARMSSGAA